MTDSNADDKTIYASNDMGSPSRFRRFNEGLYLVKHAEKIDLVDSLPPQMVKQYRKVAAQFTELRRDEFIRVRDAERAKPKHERTPHYIDPQGRLVPYSRADIERNRAAMKLPIPDTEPTYEEHVQGITKEQKEAKMKAGKDAKVDEFELAAIDKLTEEQRRDPYFR